MNPQNFNTKRNPAKILKGYFYQVQQTILYWLNLPEGQSIEIEQLEDFDIHDGKKSLKSFQIKYLNDNLNLKSPKVIECLVNFFTHTSLNSELNLSFVLLTVSKVGQEKALKGLGKGIHIWEALRLEENVNPDDLRLQKIIELFLTTTKPKIITSENWANWIKMLSNPSSLLKLIKATTLLTQMPSIEESENKILSTLKDRYRVGDFNDYYMRLFYHISYKIIQDGHRVLSINDLDKILTDNSNINYQKYFYRLEDQIEVLDARVAKIETKINTILKENIGLNSTKFDFLEGTVSFDPISLGVNISQRRGLVSSLTSNFEGKSVLLIKGEKGMGKSHLAVLVAAALKLNPMWIKLNYDSEEVTYKKLLSVFRSLSEEQLPQYNLEKYFINIFKNFPLDSIIVLDDLPRIENSNLDFLLKTLLTACLKLGKKVIITSHFNLKVKGFEEYLLFNIPSLSIAEIKEISTTYEQKSEKVDNLILGLSNGHPTLVKSIFNYLKENKWQVNDDKLIELFKGDYAENVKSQWEEVFKKTVNDDTKELIYRLDIVSNNFTDKDIDLVAMYPTEIKNANNIIQGIVGVWVQSTLDSTYRISPLIQGIGLRNLKPKVIETLNSLAADEILKKGVLSEADVTMGIIHFLHAKEFTRAGLLYNTALKDIIENEPPIEHSRIRFASFWKDTLLPKEMDLNIKLMIRAQQIKYFEMLDEDVEYQLKDLENLLETTEKPLLGIYYVAMVIASTKIQIKITLLRKIFTLGDNLETEDSKMSLRFFDLYWIRGFYISTLQEAEEWLSLLTNFTDKQIENVRKSELAIGTSKIIFDQIYSNIYEAGNKNWEEISVSLENFYLQGIRSNIEPISAAILRVIVIILIENSAVEIAELRAEKHLELWNGPSSKYLLNDTLGRNFLLNKEYSKAYTYLKIATENLVDSLDYDAVITLIDFSYAIYYTNPNPERSYSQLEKALLLIIEKNSEVSLQLKVLGEYILIACLYNDYPFAFDLLIKATKLLLNNKGMEGYKRSLIIISHQSGYIMGKLKGENEVLLDGDIPYQSAVPFAFINSQFDESKLYKPSMEYLLPMQIAMVYNDQNNYAGYEEFASLSLKNFNESNDTVNVHLLVSQLYPFLLAKSSYIEFLELIAASVVTINAEVNELGKRNYKNLVYLFLIPLSVSLCRQKLNNPLAFKSLTGELQPYINKIEDEGIRIIYTKILSILKDQAEYKKVLEEANFSIVNGDILTASALLFAGAMLSDLTPKVAFTFLNHTYNHYISSIKHSTFLTVKVYNKFIFEYWNYKFRTQRYAFKYPLILDSKLPTISEFINNIDFDTKLNELISSTID